MSDTDTGLPEGDTSTEEATVEDAFGYDGLRILGNLDEETTVDSLLRAIDDYEKSIEGEIVGQAYTETEDMFNALADAVEEGAVPPGSVLKSVAWGLLIAGGTITSVDEWKSLFLHYAVDNGHPVTNPAKTAVSPPTAIVVPPDVTKAAPPAPSVQRSVPQQAITVSVPDPTSPGGKLVAAAEAAIKRTSVSVAGLSPTEAQGVSLALAQAYQNGLTVAVSVANALEDQLSVVSADIKTLTYQVGNLSDSLAGEQNFVAGRLNIDEERIANTLTGLTTLQGELTNLQEQITAVATASPTTVVSPAGPSGIELSPTDPVLLAAIAPLATKADIAGLQEELDATDSEVSTLATQAETAGIPNSPTTMTDLEDCCEANDAITGPIRNGGATPSLLSQLGALLGEAAILGFGATVISGLLAMLDLNDSIVATVWSAEYVTGLVEQVIPVVLADVSWSDSVAATST